MANPEHLAKLKEGVEVWNAWRRENPFEQPVLGRADLSRTDLRGIDFFRAYLVRICFREAKLEGAELEGADLKWADLFGTDLQEANLSRADLFGADLRGANLYRADLFVADLREANLSQTILVRANLLGADLERADLEGAELNGTFLQGADLRGVHLGGARLRETVFADVELNDVEGLEQCEHEGPSIIDMRTIRKSWPLPLAFLRGCGLDDAFIEYIPSLIEQPFQFYSCFISYSTTDEAFARRLHADLQDSGVRCWFAPEDVCGGRKLHEQIYDAIRLHDKLLLILSEHSMTSTWVATEIKRARRRARREGRQMLFPIRLCSYEELQDWELFDADEGRDLAAEVRSYFIPDFSTWKDHDAYEPAFQRLLRDLKADAPAGGTS